MEKLRKLGGLSFKFKLVHLYEPEFKLVPCIFRTLEVVPRTLFQNCTCDEYFQPEQCLGLSLVIFSTFGLQKKIIVCVATEMDKKMRGTLHF